MGTQRQLQQRIRHDAEESKIALQELTSWMETTKNTITLKTTKPAKHNRSVSPTEGTYEEIRTRGNDFFAQKKFSEAVECYTHCLVFKEALATPTIHSNRALANIKLKNWTQAEEDATLALQICPNYSKSFYHRSTARLSLGKLRAALMDVSVAEGRCDAEGLKKEIEVLKSKCENALINAVKRAPRRRVKVAIV